LPGSFFIGPHDENRGAFSIFKTTA